MWAFVLLLVSGGGTSCVDNAVAMVDGTPISDADVRLVQKLESLTGLKIKQPDAFLTAIEKRALVALARRQGAVATHSVLSDQLEESISNNPRQEKLQRIIRTVGKQAYLEWSLEPELSEAHLQDHYRMEADRVARDRATRLLRMLIAGRTQLQTIFETPQQDLQYSRFTLTPRDMLNHFGKGMREDYLERLERFRDGLAVAKPNFPAPPIEEVEGLGLGDRGYVRKLAKAMDTVADGQWIPNVLRDRHQWMVLRRVSAADSVYRGDGIRVHIPNFHDWLVFRYTELKFEVCSNQMMEAVRAHSPGNSFVEILQLYRTFVSCFTPSWLFFLMHVVETLVPVVAPEA